MLLRPVVALAIHQILRVLAAKVYYHGSKTPITEITKGKKWKAFDGKTVDSPIWLTEDRSFAKLNAGPNGHVYEVEFSPKKTFPEDDLLEMRGGYFELSRLGEKVLAAIENGDIPLVEGSRDKETAAYDVLESMNKLNYDVMETAAVINWAKKNGYDSVWVRGDGPTNLMVLHPEKVKLT